MPGWLNVTIAALQTAASLVGVLPFAGDQPGHVGPRDAPPPTPATNAQLLSAGFGIAEGIFELGAAAALDFNGSGENDMLPFQNSSQALGQDFLNTYTSLYNDLGGTSTDKIGLFNNLIVSDYGKLQAVINIGPELGPGVTGAVENSMIMSARQSVYEQLVPLAFVSMDVGDLSGSKCGPIPEFEQNPWPGILSRAPSNTLWTHTVGFSSTSSGVAPITDTWFFNFFGTVDVGSGQAPPSNLVQALFSLPKSYDVSDVNADFGQSWFFEHVLGNPKKCALPIP
jgi:hypothetical protein